MRGRKLFAVMLAVGLSVMSSVCAFADVKTLDNGVQAVVCKGTDETGNVTVTNKTFMVSNATKNPMNVVMQGTVVKTLQSNESWAIGTNMDCVLGYTYSAKNNTLTITEANANASAAATAAKSTEQKVKKPSGTHVAGTADVAGLIEYANSLGIKSTYGDSGKLYFLSPDKKIMIISYFGADFNVADMHFVKEGQVLPGDNLTVDGWAGTFELLTKY